MSNLIKTYYQLTKPGIIYGNAITTTAGFLLASKGHIDFWLFVTLLVGISLMIASGCVFNNYIDRGIDVKMARTKKRALVSGSVTGRSALIYASVLGLTGFLILIKYTNLLTIGVGVIAFIDYVIFYGFAKRHSVHGTLVGTISGAAPIVAGYVAVTNRLDLGAALLFLIMTAWQMPHFFAIAMYRYDDYKAAGLPVWPVKKGFQSTKIQMVLYVIAFMIASVLLSAFGYAGYSYLAIMVVVSLAWLRLGLQGFKATDNSCWARRMFGFSLVTLLIFCSALAVVSFVP
jgi:protoheme IX farnesyltransferase